MNYIQKVTKFQDVFGHHIGDDQHSVEPLMVRQLRIKLLFEELAELAEASDCRRTFHVLCNNYEVDKEFDAIGGEPIKDGDNVNKVEELDALCDLQYVLTGKVITAGFQKIFDEAFDAVHQNNMDKAHKTLIHVHETVEDKELTINDVNIRTVDHETFVLLNNYGKVIKPHNHKKVDLSKFFEK